MKVDLLILIVDFIFWFEDGDGILVFEFEYVSDFFD